ncbi:MAG: DUF4293 domain-containing protein [Bacteroidales bacterium]|nr:DUF4293 domain-containing protein [Bacteroidales bacterium]MBD5242281.1 DUF4293 domain-containing protein [Barnesiella sp.]MBD5256986.1 DUF4293 domain-containing protein [Bacteroides sp.]MDE5821249.1 DUF4293 domain-containing protein [Paramuribaculum sp.]MDE5837037.1 DUF4293 domain-containing protein [Paramuribaculum sp.]
MIQRIQTLYLIIAIGLMVAFFFVPFGYSIDTVKSAGAVMEQGLTGLNQGLSLIIPVSLSLLTMAIAIFSFRSLSGQKALIGLSALIIGACIGVVIYYLTAGYSDTNPDIDIRTVWGGGGLLLIAAEIALFGAYRGVSHDQKLLRSYDRIR